MEAAQVKALWLDVLVRVQMLWGTFGDETGQDLIEYALVCALVAFGAIAGMQSLASGINTAFSNITNTLTTSA
jgi:pilus assembly protein Flp/PilA